jgi:NAD(P)-dependent dehydrogenase (short-subunit alcohol dehydrogenase family)
MTCEDLKGRRVLVTGASSGIGSAAAILFSEQNCYIGVHYFHTPEGAEKTLEQVKKNSNGIMPTIEGEKRCEIQSVSYFECSVRLPY